MEKGNQKPKAEKPKVADREIHAAPSDRQILSDRERRASDEGLSTYFFPKENPPVAVRAASAEEAARIIAANQKHNVR